MNAPHTHDIKGNKTAVVVVYMTSYICRHTEIEANK